jgi:TP53 regulating kinase and related kinases
MTSDTTNIIGRGAEAILIHENNNLVKRRIKKSYRIDIIDQKLRKQRTRKEAKLLEKAIKLIPVPKVKKVSDTTMEIDMEFLEGKKLSEHLDTLENAEEICKEIGQNIAKLHDADIIHGDLTTSNMILSSKDNKVYFIDFGLGFESKKIEDKAVDLHLIKQALEAKHFNHYERFFKAILEGYKASKHHEATINRLKAVEKRGRYKGAY